ncbi:MAG: hypothetical protein AAB899_01075 [Patescibacteria group bacterium]
MTEDGPIHSQEEHCVISVIVAAYVPGEVYVCESVNGALRGNPPACPSPNVIV